MLFNSLEFLYFFPVAVILYFLIPVRQRWAISLAASYYFYMSWKPEYLILIIISTVVDYFAAIKISQASKKSTRKRLLFLSLFVNLGLLGFFKYFNFFSENINFLIEALQIPVVQIPYSDFLLPVGISFYTFQTLSYSIDVYRGKITPERHLGRFAVFVSFWPQLVAGPIERAENLIPQLKADHKFNSTQVIWGINQIAYGFFKKIVVADRLALYVDQVFNHPDAYNTVPLCIAIFFFAIQIYCDFSGYSDIAIGCARIMGIDLMENFQRPYLSLTITEFWRKWHISLSTWFKDYVYIPLGGNQVSLARNYFNLFFTFLVSGIWHGAGWNFIIWGAIHGIMIVVEKMLGLQKIRPTHLSAKLFRWFTTFFIVCFAWIFFRSESFSESLLIIKNIIELDFSFNLVQWCAEEGPFNLFLSFLVVLMLILSYLLPMNYKFSINKSILFNLILLVIIIILGENGKEEFIYFQF